ncbi:flagellar export chaperone FliS [Opitutus terrae]|uniref:Flagellar secretion chaperone FliS n=1 Tax=Opitutus terrae (strain DSM 11246 / JCM 15787 / PB90-1) TaxID=452637 RepID=B1ZR60_OPITP|nr:flagellar export chaperone FliS [Opitutus terrae]ACB73731.1 flagellar protein FliS [Opitutus terrae PB90-1]
MLAKGYVQTYRTNAVLTASPAQLVLMLYDGALKAMSIAREAMERTDDDPRRIETINHQLQKAQNIVLELQGGLNFEVGGDFAKTLHRLYDYHYRRLFEANLRKDLAPLIEVEGLLRQLRDAWAEMLTKQEPDKSEQLESLRGVA